MRVSFPSGCVPEDDPFPGPHSIAELSVHDQARYCIRHVEVPFPTRRGENQLVSKLPLHAALMRPKAVAEQSGDESHKAGDSYALAVEPDASQAAILERMLGARIGGTLKVVGSTEEAFAELERRLPDLILVSPLLAPQDEEQIVARLAARGGDASHVQLLSIPRIRDGEQPSEKKRRFGWQSQKDSSSVSEGCDPVAFANEVADYLAQAATLRQASQPVDRLRGCRAGGWRHDTRSAHRAHRAAAPAVRRRAAAAHRK